jgi:pimeloyl-ACP methyl ester carboxylesterase
MQVKTFDAPNPDGNVDSGGTHKISYTDWGSEHKNFVICVHGLTRNGRDFDFVAERLAQNFRVICPDMAGRGKSAWLPNYEWYNNEVQVADTLALAHHLGAKNFDWIGTSMGGLMGMIIAALHPHLIKKMVINDIGAFISADGMRRIKGYVKDEILFDSREHAEKRYREIFAPFHIETELQWQHMFLHGLRETKDGKFSFNHDPAMGKAFAGERDFDLWRLWEAFKVPTLLLRGEKSDILPRDVALRMAQKAGVEFVEFPRFGHVPPLMNDEQIGVVERFLRG